MSTSNLIALAALLVSIYSLRSSNASSEAAKKSASAAETSVRHNTTTLLEKHFNNIEHLIDAFSMVEPTYGERLMQCRNSYTFLRFAYKNDPKIQNLLNCVGLYLECESPSSKVFFDFIKSNYKASESTIFNVGMSSPNSYKNTLNAIRVEMLATQ